MDDVLKALREAGFTPLPNSDEDFPAVEGEYGVSVRALRPWVNEETDIKEAYLLQLTISQTLSGEMADGRLFSRFYGIAGNGYDGVALTSEQINDNIRHLLNDIFTMGVQLDLSSTEAFEASFANAIDAKGFVRAWKSKNRNNPEGPMGQRFRIKTAKDLRRGSQEAKASRTAQAPF